jgi:hypothetical protein
VLNKFFYFLFKTMVKEKKSLEEKNQSFKDSDFVQD